MQLYEDFGLQLYVVYCYSQSILHVQNAVNLSCDGALSRGAITHSGHWSAITCQKGHDRQHQGQWHGKVCVSCPLSVPSVLFLNFTVCGLSLIESLLCTRTLTCIAIEAADTRTGAAHAMIITDTKPTQHSVTSWQRATFADLKNFSAFLKLEPCICLHNP